MSTKRILVTGGNAGIGFALCKQLVKRGCHVFLGARSVDKGEQAVQEILTNKSASGSIEFVQIDVASDESVSAAAEKLASAPKLYAVVNNAGTGLQHGVTPEVVINTNLYGPKRVCEAFLGLIDPEEGRIVNVGSGGGPSYVSRCDVETQKKLCDSSVTWEWISSYARSALGSSSDTNGGYGLSKALLTCYSMVLSREQPKLKVSVVTPGFIQTAMTEGWGASKSPEEGTVSIMHCLFEELDGSGWYYGSDAVRSPLHYMRNPGEPAYDGSDPFQK